MRRRRRRRRRPTRRAVLTTTTRRPSRSTAAAAAAACRAACSSRPRRRQMPAVTDVSTLVPPPAAAAVNVARTPPGLPSAVHCSTASAVAVTDPSRDAPVVVRVHAGRLRSSVVQSLPASVRRWLDTVARCVVSLCRCAVSTTSLRCVHAVASPPARLLPPTSRGPNPGTHSRGGQSAPHAADTPIPRRPVHRHPAKPSRSHHLPAPLPQSHTPRRISPSGRVRWRNVDRHRGRRPRAAAEPGVRRLNE